MKISEIPQIVALSKEEKLDLIDQLWESISPEMENGDVSDEVKGLLDERWERHLAHPEASISLEELKKLWPIERDELPSHPARGGG